MFDFFKKNKPAQPEVAKEEVPAPPAAPNLPVNQEPVLKETVKVDNVIIHVMPGRFRNQPVKQDSAKTTGLVIIIGGVAVLLAASAAMYYFLFSKPSVTVTEEPPLITENNQANRAEEEVNQIAPADTLAATGTELTTLPSGDEVATTTVATTTPDTSITTEPDLLLGEDSDNDGLTDIEEILLSTGTSTPDTDGDGYFDGAELLNLYNPAGAGKLTANSNISLYENKTFAYDLLYLSTWLTSVNGGDDSVMFKSGDNQFVQIIVQPNVNRETLDEWYTEQLSVLAIGEADRVSGSNWQGLKSPDGLNVYLMDNKQNYIFSLTYNPGDRNVLEYSNIFQMMIKSFNLKD